MTACLIAAVLLASPDVQIRITPDQPLPFAYVDEPLIVEVASSKGEGEASVRVEIDGENGPTTTLDLGSIALKQDDPFWSPLKDVASVRDRYLARFTVTVAGSATRLEQSFCRIDRPVAGPPFPLSAWIEGEPAQNIELALAAVPGRAIRLNANRPDLESRAEVAHANGIQVVVAFPLDRLDEDAAALGERLAGRLGDRVLRWEAEPGDASESLGLLAGALRRSGSRAPLALVAPNAASLARLLASGAGEHANALVLAQDAPGPAELREFRLAAERAGLEGLPLMVLSRGVRSNVMQPGERLSRQILANLTAGAETEVNSKLILDRGRFGSEYVQLCGMARRIQNAVHVGELELGPGVRAEVLRQDDGWLLALWSDEPRDVTLESGKVKDLRLTDARNNPMHLPETPADALTLRAGPDPIYLSGTGGTVLVDSARRSAVLEAQDLLALKDFPKRLPRELVGPIRVLAEKGSGSLDRRGFLALLGLFRALEQQRSAGALPTELAVPVSAGLARMVRDLCAVEQERGEPFLEPLQEMLAKCSAYTSKYLAESNGGAAGYRRQDWILGEVGRLMAEARQLESVGRPIEADAVAALAEARARSLEFAGPASNGAKESGQPTPVASAP